MRAIRSTLLLTTLVLISLAATCTLQAQPPTLESRVQRLVADHKGKAAIAIKDLTTGETISETVYDDRILRMSPDRRWLLADGTTFEPGVPAPIHVYQAEPFSLVATLEGHTEIVRFIRWSPDSRRFASVGGPALIIVWELVGSD